MVSLGGLLGAKAPAHDLMPGVHRVASLLKRWILGTHHGAIQPSQLDHYFGSIGASGSRGMLFYRLLQQAVVTDPVTYAGVVCRTGAKWKKGNKGAHV